MLKRCLKKSRILFAITLVCALISSISVSLISLTSGVEDGQSNIMSYVIAAVFWIGLILMFISVFLTKKTLYKYREKLIVKGHLERQRLPGIFSFSLKRNNIILYSVMALGFILIISDIVLSYVPEAIMFPIISVTILSVTMHCIIDGKYYKVYKLIKENTNNETNHSA